MCKMITHRVPGSLGLARRNGIAHDTMLVERGAPRARVLEIMRKLREIGIEALVKELADHTHQHGIAEASGDRDMEGAVVDHRGLAGMVDILHCDEGGVDARDIVLDRKSVV